MSDPKLGRRYAQALYNAAKGEGVTDDVIAAMNDVVAPMLDDHTFLVWWRSRRIPLPEKLTVLDKAFKDSHIVVRQFLKLLLEKKREEILPDAVSEFRIIADREQGIIRALLTTPVELEEAELKPFREMLKKVAGGDAILAHEVDTGLIGGFRLRYGDKVIDGSVSRALDTLQRKMTAGV
ncbi:ATP synthase F1 subunit delta [bacterium]|nr:ATP synthase F1 subunit delta [bacterium]